MSDIVINPAVADQIEHPPVLPAEVTELAESQQGAALELLARLIDPTQDGAS